MTLDDVRQFYAEEVRLAAPLYSQRVVEAFRRVPREQFLGPGPWQIPLLDIGSGAASLTTDDGEARHVYHNVSVALDPNRQLFNGQPATVGRWIDELAIQPGDRVFHLGCGSGYYTAIMAEVAGPGGRVVASEVDSALAARAQTNLSRYPNVTVASGDGAEVDPGVCDAILINAGVTLPLPAWLDRLREGGRMVVPLTFATGGTLGKGLVAKITRAGDEFAARVVSFVMIYSCTSARDPQLDPALAKALSTGALLKWTTVRRDPHPADETCIVHGAEVCLSSAQRAPR
jgi:protein-L-isoaspartate(D-aspartate) O-methyltransferase